MHKVSRRDFLISSGFVASTVGAQRNCIASVEKQPFRLSYVVASCLYGKMALAEILPEINHIGTEWLDLWPTPHGNQREQVEVLSKERFRTLLSRYNTRLGMTTRFDLSPFALADELRVVSELGGRLVVTGSTPIKALSAPETKAAVALFIEKMKPQLSIAEELNVAIGIENHSATLIHTLDSMRYFAELSPSSKLGIALAPYHLPQDEKLIVRLISDLGPKLVHFYAWQYGQGCTKVLSKNEELEQLPGRGKLDFRQLLTALRQINYQGWTEIFMHSTPRGLPIHDTAAKTTAEINRAKKYLEECLL